MAKIIKTEAELSTGVGHKDFISEACMKIKFDKGVFNFNGFGISQCSDSKSLNGFDFSQRSNSQSGAVIKLNKEIKKFKKVVSEIKTDELDELLEFVLNVEKGVEGGQ